MIESGLLFPKHQVYEGNANAILWITESKFEMRSIHLDVKLALCTEFYEDDMFEIVSVESRNNVGDLMTKVLGEELHEKHLNFIARMWRCRIQGECRRMNPSRFLGRRQNLIL
jgi:hypothetical protein